MNLNSNPLNSIENSLAFTSFILWLSLFPYLIIMILYFRNRRLYPIKGRFPIAALIENLVIFLSASQQWAHITFQYHCEINLWSQFLAICIFQASFNYRLVQLVFAYEISSNISEMKEKQNSKEWKVNWWVAHRHFAQERFIFIISCILTLIYLLIFILFFFLSSHSPTCNSMKYSRLSFVLYLKDLIGILFSIFLAIKLWKYPNDAFGIKSEFKFSIGTAIYTIASFAIIIATSSIIISIFELGFILMVHPLLFVSIARPYWESRKTIVQDEIKQTYQLDSWLKTSDGINSFYEYLTLEFSSENLLFWIDVSFYQKLPYELNVIKQTAHHIYMKYLDFQAPCKINLPHEIYESLSTNLQQLLETLKIGHEEDALHIFDQAQTEIYQLMAGDSFPRFQTTSAYHSRICRRGSQSHRSVSSDSKTELDLSIAKNSLLGIKVDVSSSPEASPNICSISLASRSELSIEKNENVELSGTKP